MARWFGGAMLLVLVGGGVLSTLVTDQDCTETCNDDLVKLTALALAFVVGVAWLVVAVSKEARWLRERKRREREQDPEADG